MLAPSSSESRGLGKCGGDSGVASESWVWVESVEDDGSRSGHGFWREALYVVLSIHMVGLSHGLSRDRMQLCAVQCGGQFIIMQPDGSWQFILVPEVSWQFILIPEVSWQFILVLEVDRHAGDGE